MPWQELVDYSETHDLLAKRLYVVFSGPTDGWGQSWTRSIRTSRTRRVWRWTGRCSMEEARGHAECDPMHQAGARTFRIRPWLLNEGTLGLQVFLSGGKPKVL
jgi:uncharacterized protein